MKCHKYLYFLLFFLIFIALSGQGKATFAGPGGSATSTSNDDEETSPGGGRGMGRGCVVGDLVEITYDVISGPSIDAYFCNDEDYNSGKPISKYIYFNDDSSSGSWSYTVESNQTYWLVFRNDKTQTITYSWEFKITHNPGGTVIPFGQNYIIICSIVGVSLILLVRSRKNIIVKK